MPLYEYVCDACSHRFEIIQKFSDPPPETCPSCGKGPVVRQHSSPAIQFKGTGWYITDYAQKGKSGESGKSDGTKSGSANTDAGKTDGAKSEGASTAKTDTAAKSETTTKSEKPAGSKTDT